MDDGIEHGMSPGCTGQPGDGCAIIGHDEAERAQQIRDADDRYAKVERQLIAAESRDPDHLAAMAEANIDPQSGRLAGIIARRQAELTERARLRGLLVEAEAMIRQVYPYNTLLADAIDQALTDGPDDVIGQAAAAALDGHELTVHPDGTITGYLALNPGLRGEVIALLNLGRFMAEGHSCCTDPGDPERFDHTIAALSAAPAEPGCLHAVNIESCPYGCAADPASAAPAEPVDRGSMNPHTGLYDDEVTGLVDLDGLHHHPAPAAPAEERETGSDYPVAMWCRTCGTVWPTGADACSCTCVQGAVGYEDWVELHPTPVSVPAAAPAEGPGDDAYQARLAKVVPDGPQLDAYLATILEPGGWRLTVFDQAGALVGYTSTWVPEKPPTAPAFDADSPSIEGRRETAAERFTADPGVDLSDPNDHGLLGGGS